MSAWIRAMVLLMVVGCAAPSLSDAPVSECLSPCQLCQTSLGDAQLDATALGYCDTELQCQPGLRAPAECRDQVSREEVLEYLAQNRSDSFGSHLPFWLAMTPADASLLCRFQAQEASTDDDDLVRASITCWDREGDHEPRLSLELELLIPVVPMLAGELRLVRGEVRQSGDRETSLRDGGARGSWHQTPNGLELVLPGQWSTFAQQGELANPEGFAFTLRLPDRETFPVSSP